MSKPVEWADKARELAAGVAKGRGNRTAHCPNCGMGANGYTCAIAGNNDLAGAVPIEGDAALCAYCGHLNVYRADQTLRPATEKERDECAALMAQVGRCDA